MDHEFQVQSTISVDELRLSYHVYYFKKNKSSIIPMIVIGVLVLLWTVFNVIKSLNPAYASGSDATLNPRYIVLALVFGFTLINFPFYAVRQAAKQVYKNHIASRLPLQNSWRISENGLQVENEQSTSIIRWNQLGSGYVYRNHLFLFQGNSIINLDLAQMVTGTPSELLEFVGSKIPLKGDVSQQKIGSTPTQQRNESALPQEQISGAAHSSKNAKENPAFIRAVLLTLFILTFFTIHLSSWLGDWLTMNPHTAATYPWLFFLPMLLPLASLVLGIIYKRKGYKAIKNIVVGIIFSVLLAASSFFNFALTSLYSHNYYHVQRIESKIHFDLPDTGDITRQDWAGATATGAAAHTVQYAYTSDIVFTDATEIAKLNAEISHSDHWLTTINTPLMGLIPPLYSSYASSSQYDYYMIYNVDLETYNTLPDRSGTYDFIFIAYNSRGGKMKIGEYALWVDI